MQSSSTLFRNFSPSFSNLYQSQEIHNSGIGVKASLISEILHFSEDILECHQHIQNLAFLSVVPIGNERLFLVKSSTFMSTLPSSAMSGLKIGVITFISGIFFGNVRGNETMNLIFAFSYMPSFIKQNPCHSKSQIGLYLQYPPSGGTHTSQKHQSIGWLICFRIIDSYVLF